MVDGRPNETNSYDSAVNSVLTAVGDEAVIADTANAKRMCWVSARFYDGADKNTAGTATPTAGTLAIQVQTTVNGLWEPTPVEIDAAIPTTFGIYGPIKAIKAVPTGIDVATHYEIAAEIH